MKTIIATILALLIGHTLQSTARADITTGLEGYWKLNDGSGSPTAADTSGNSNTGTLTSFADTTFMNMWTTGGPVGNTTLTFNQNGENTNYVTVPNSTSLNAPTTAKAWTVAVWVKLSVAGSSQVNNAGIVAKGNLNAEQYALYINGGKFQGTMHNAGDTGTESVTSTFTPLANVWYHVAYVFRTGINPEAYIYINGVSNNVGALNTFTTVYSTNLPVTIGNRYNTVANGGTNNLPFQGTIAEARVYNRALGYGATNSPADIWQLYTNGIVAPTFAAQPRNVTCYSNDTAAFAVALNAPIFGTYYQWYFATSSATNPISGANSNILALANVTSGNAGTYLVVCTNIAGSITSAPATLTVNPLPAANSSSGLVGWWKFDDGTGSATAADSSGNGNTGTLANFTDLTFTTEWVNGIIGGALNFNGDGSGLNTVAIPNIGSPGPAVLDFSTSPLFTLAAWVNPSLMQSNSAAIICKGTGGGGEQYCLDINGGNFRLFVRDTNGLAYNAQSSVANNGTWQHVAGVLDGTNGILNLYVNGVLAASAMAPYSLLATNHEVSIGNRQGGTASYGDAFTGAIDDVRIYHRALTSVDVNNLYSANAFPIIVTQSPAVSNSYTLYAGAHPSYKLLSLTGVAPFSYYWFTNGVLNAAATGTNMTLTNVQAGFITNFCIVSNSLGTATSIVWTASVIAAPTQPYPAAVLAANPIGYWRLNETNLDGINDGVFANDYWAGNFGIYSNTVLGEPGYNSTTDPNTTSAYFGSALSDSDAYGIGGVNFGAPTNTSVSFSIEAWVNGYLQTKDSGIVSLGYGNGGEQFDLDTGNDAAPISHGFRFLVRDASGNSHSAIAPVLPANGFWQHLVGVCDEVHSNLTLYVNGVAAGTGTIAPGSGLLASTRSMLIGSRPSSSTSANDDQFVGYVNDVAVYNYALSASQVAAQYSAAGVPPNFTLAPPASVAADGDGTLTIPALIIGTTNLSYQWYDVNGGTNVATGSTNAVPLNATLTVSNVPSSWNNDTLTLTAANSYGSTNISVTIIAVPPQITRDLSPVAIVSGYSYTYSIGVGSLPPLGYEWYNGTTPVASGPTYTVTAGSPGSTTYFVVITNVYGATTSSVSALTSIVPLTNSLATNIASYNPVGYWPLHEVEPAAPGDIETNYGTLGLLGTAYYTDWATNYGAFNRGQPGAIAADSDPSVYFTSTKNNGGATTNDLVIAHNSPQTTLTPPFSVECWQYPTVNNLQGDVWSQSGFEGLNSGNSEGNGAGNVSGVRLYWGGQGWAIYSYYNGGPLSSPYGNSGYTPNQWYHLVVTCDVHTNFALWVDGVGATNNPGVGLFSPDYWSPFIVGNGRGDSRALPESDVDEVAIYNYVLPDSAITNHYSTGTNTSPATPYFQTVTNDHPAVYLRMDSVAYTPPPMNTWPTVTNYGTVGGLGVYTPGTMPGLLPGPSANGQSFTGLSGGAVAALSGVSSYADVGYDPTFNPTGAKPFSVTAIFRCNPCDDRPGNWETIVGHSDSSWRVAMNTSSGQLGYTIGTGANGNSTHIYNDGNWHQLVAVYTPASNPNVVGTNLLYVDGVLDSTTNGVSTNGISPGSSSDVLIGNDPQYTNSSSAPGFGRSFAGQICEVALFTNVLTASQVQTMFSTLSVPPYITGQPVGGQSVNPTNGSSAEFSVTAGGNPLAYQWYFNSSASYSGAAQLVNNVTHYINSTTAQVTITNLTTADSGYYFVVITNNYGSATSALASLTVVQVTPGLMSVTNLLNGQLQLVWSFSGTLQTATNVAGPYVTVTNAGLPVTASPYAISLTNGQQFYRIRQQ
jgi:hypothetical protein